MDGIIAEAEVAYQELEVETSDSQARRVKVFFRTLTEITGVALDPDDFTSFLDQVYEVGARRREAALFIIRSLQLSTIVQLPFFQDSHCQRRIVKLCEKYAPDICQKFDLEKCSQTYEKFDIISNMHDRTVLNLDILHKLSSNPSTFLSDQSVVSAVVNNHLTKSLFHLYDFDTFSTDVKDSYSHVKSVTAIEDDTFTTKFQLATDALEAINRRYSERTDFLATRFAIPFFSTVLAVLRTIGNDSIEKFRCNLRPKFPASGVVERRYPLHDNERILRIRIPLTNEGPGPAIDAIAELNSVSDRAILLPERIELGKVNAGDLSIFFDVAIEEPLEALPVMVRLSWRTARGSERVDHISECTFLSQASGIAWEDLAQTYPYSTEVAEGAQFVGRVNKLNSLIGRLRKTRMQSSFITGQKRVGKTSLALAVRDRLEADSDVHSIYLEYGEYAQSSAAATIRELCLTLYNKFCAFGAQPTVADASHDKSSLSVLNRLADSILSANSSTRILIILDEFDEIQQEMYRHGPIAEAFFANLRTLAAKPNLAFMLVGGENMPFIMAAQGDQLNKFVKEPVDYFSRDEEWDDFSNLVRSSDNVPFTWHDSSINAIFDYTNGHPFYTKLLCQIIFQRSVEARDADITAEEVDIAVMYLVQRLDTNSFAHFWKDGIAAVRDEAEVIALKRCRVLVAMARVKRAGDKLTLENIAKAATALNLRSTDVAPLLNDFCRREIMQESGGVYSFITKLFAEWLTANGLNKLIADTLGDELEASIASEEDAAYVTSPEIVQLVDKWPLYKGKRVTAEHLRAWLDQVKTNREKRVLFRILGKLRILGEEEVRGKLRQAHSLVKQRTTNFVPSSRSQRRFDLLVTYVDGPAKSGNIYASRYAEENLISSTCVIAMEDFEESAAEAERKSIASGLVIIDDIAATGESLSENLRRFMGRYRNFVEHRSLPIVVVVLLATKEADVLVRSAMKEIGYLDIDLRVCEYLDESNHVLSARNWSNEEEVSVARQLCMDLGRRVYKNNPLGYGDKGLNVVFFDTCPNNTIPIVHSAGPGWFPLFPRSTN